MHLFRYLAPRFVLSWCLVFLLVSCSSAAVKRSVPPGIPLNSPTEGAPSPVAIPSPSEDESDDIDGNLDDEEDDGKVDEKPTQDQGVKKNRVPFEFNQKVATWIQYFSQKDRERFQRYLDRGEPYREVIENILEENNVPADLYYLGLIESGFDFRAKSHAKAMGVWQFMRSTGKLYGLSVDAYMDERKDPIRATEAAAKHLRDLYREFKSWYLALSAYNAGIGRIRGAIKRGGSHDFWTLVERKALPRETMEYVPKFLAARYIGEHPDLFAFYINEEKKYPNVELVQVPSPVNFEKIEKTCSLPVGTLSFVNPQYLMSFTHPGKKVDQIWVPEAYQKQVEGNFKQLGVYRIHVRPERAVVVAKPVKVLWHTVKSGDTLKSIARRRGLSVAYLKRVNGIKSSRVLVGQRLKLSATSYQQKNTHPRKSRKRRSR